MKMDTFDRVALAHCPTPVEKLDRLSAHLGGPQIFIKRDDYTGFGLGGNKARKLEYLVADALAKGCDTLVTMGGVQSNHCRQTAAAAARFGLKCELVLTQGALDTDDFMENGNVLLDRLTGCTMHFVGAVPDKMATFDAIVAAVAARGGKPYAIPVGGSNPLGCLGYARAVAETAGQVDLAGFRAVVVTTGSAGTHAGLLAGVGALKLPVEVVGISCAATAEVLRPKIAGMARETLALLGTDAKAPEVVIDEGHIGPGYGVPTQEGVEAIRLCARLEGVYLDPVYTGKAMAGLIALIGAGRFEARDRVLFMHTGGSTALFAYRSALGL